MRTAYRIFKTKHAANWLDGEGAFLYGGRWNSRGTRVLYASQSLSLAALEMLVHINSEMLLLSYSFATVEFDDDLVMPVEQFQKLPSTWSDSPPPTAIQQIGDDWTASRDSVVLKVPSAVVPVESNYLVNISHKDFSRVKLGKPKPFSFDPRLSVQ
jgi:RES domain-containing protein